MTQAMYTTTVRSDGEDALLFSGSTFFKLGTADIKPMNALSRALSVIEGGAGFLMIFMAVTYLLNVYPVLSRKVAVADTLNQVTGGRADGVSSPNHTCATITATR